MPPTIKMPAGFITAQEYRDKYNISYRVLIILIEHYDQPARKIKGVWAIGDVPPLQKFNREIITQVHELKTWQPYFNDVKSGKKTFEARKNDRKPKFHVGDHLFLREYSPVTGYGLGCILVRVSYVLTDLSWDGLKPGFVILGIEKVEKGESECLI